jgi:lipopolysaccharide heptosyltransferase II
MPTGPRVLIVRFSSLGDVVLTTPLVRAIRTRHPDATITFVTKRHYAPLLAGNPHLDRVVALEPGESVGSLASRLAGESFDACLDLHGNLRSLLLRRSLKGRWTGYRKRRLERWRLLWLGGASSRADHPVAERYFDAARVLDVRPDGRPAEVFPSAGEQHAAAELAPRPFVALTPGAQHRTKRWPARHWRALAALVRNQGLDVVALGTDAERPLLDQPGVISGFGLSLGMTAALLGRARLAVCNDSGLMHLATAAGAPVVALFGPTVQGFGFAPYRAKARIVERYLACRPCSPTGGAFCPLLHRRCLEGIDPETVARAMEAA